MVSVLVVPQIVQVYVFTPDAPQVAFFVTTPPFHTWLVTFAIESVFVVPQTVQV